MNIESHKVRLPVLCYSPHLSHNNLRDIYPENINFDNLKHLDLSHNSIGTRPDSETSRDGWENFKHATLQQLHTFKLNDNALDWDQKTFNEQIAMLKEKKACSPLAPAAAMARLFTRPRAPPPCALR